MDTDGYGFRLGPRNARKDAESRKRTRLIEQEGNRLGQELMPRIGEFEFPFSLLPRVKPNPLRSKYLHSRLFVPCVVKISGLSEVIPIRVYPWLTASHEFC